MNEQAFDLKKIENIVNETLIKMEFYCRKDCFIMKRISDGQGFV